MELELWRKAESLFYQALELTDAEQVAFIAAQCANDIDLQQLVSQLVLHSGKPFDIQYILGNEAAQWLSVQQDLSGSSLGAYRLLRQLGTGGMATVYLAERSDQQFQEHVAVKVLAARLIHAELLEAFTNERQILAKLKHDAICRFLDGGTTASGMPFLVMEYINGLPIDDYCAQKALTLNAILRLYLQVAAAVAYAHQQHAIHCDLKPANILIDKLGNAKLLDFGIARFLNHRHSLMLTCGQSARWLTAEYASPEQLNNQPISQHTDIYALGVILKKLLGDMLTADLQDIVSRATALQLADRYQSVFELVQDIKHYLAD